MHNLRGYGSHIILKQAFELVGKKERISAITQSCEIIMTFSIGGLKFKDSFQFMAARLDKLVEALVSKDIDDNFEHFTKMKNILQKVS